ncbi:MAG: ribbon-helix-helix domain-containing protein [Nitrosospira sp.]|nr:ribbon-helix-helix domain-containing protein [Nitrosospira sp.]MDN5882187.1 ribbon-helix-helix domain-containing protein [Nitrosospira sp.]
MENTARWTIKVSRDTDISLRTYLAQQGKKKGDLSKFIERAVQKEILAQTVADMKQRNADLSEKKLEALIDEAVSAVRAEIRSEAKVKTKAR